jgi:hypothetical protein
VRDSKNPAGPVLSVSADAWTAFVESARRGEFGRTVRSTIPRLDGLRTQISAPAVVGGCADLI